MDIKPDRSIRACSYDGKRGKRRDESGHAFCRNTTLPSERTCEGHPVQKRALASVRQTGSCQLICASIFIPYCPIWF